MKLIKYLGKIGETREELERHLGRYPNDSEMEIYEIGVKDRKLEIKAIELEFAKRQGKIKDWVKR